MSNNKKTVSFESTIHREGNDLPVLVSASVCWTAANQNLDFQSGYLVEDLVARHVSNGPELELNDIDKSQLKGKALEEYLKES